MFPRDALNVRMDVTGNGTTTLLSNSQPLTVLYESFNTSASNNGASLKIACYPNILLLRVNDFSHVPQIERFKAAKCTTDITINVSGTTGSPDTTVSLIYVPRDRTTTADPYPYNTNDSIATDTPKLSDGYMGVVLLIIISAFLAIDFVRRFFAPHAR